MNNRNCGVWVCDSCGEKYGHCRFDLSTWHIGVCDYCGETKPVTESRDYGYPELPKEPIGNNDRARKG